MEYILSSFSLQMVADGATIQIIPQKNMDVYISMRSPKIVIGHEGTALSLAKRIASLENAFNGNDSHMKGDAGISLKTIPVSRDRVELFPGDMALICQPTGERLTPGTEVAVPDLSFFIVRIYAANSRVVTPEWFEKANDSLANET